MAEITDAVAMVRKSAGFGAAFAAALAGVLGEAAPVLDERARRVLAGAGARQLGRGGIKLVAAAMGASADTVGKGVAELEGGLVADGRGRAKGGGGSAGGGGGGGVVGSVDRGGSDVAASVEAEVDGEAGRHSHAAGSPGGAQDGGQAVEGPRLQPAGQRQEARGGPAPGPRRPVRLPERPGQRVSGRG